MADGKNRIERTSVARSPKPSRPFWQSPAFQRVAVAVGSTVLALSCPLLPPGGRKVCEAVVSIVHVAGDALSTPPATPPPASSAGGGDGRE